jgi:effector-binding domain-containing protein
MKKTISTYLNGKAKPASWNQLFHHLESEGFVTRGPCCVFDSRNTCFVDGISPALASAIQQLVNAEVIRIKKIPDPVEAGVMPSILCRGHNTCATQVRS